MKRNLWIDLKILKNSCSFFAAQTTTSPFHEFQGYFYQQHFNLEQKVQRRDIKNSALIFPSRGKDNKNHFFRGNLKIPFHLKLN
jgi:hypothetical protein